MTLEKTLAVAICDEFWRTAETPRTYATSMPMQRQVWDQCAFAAIAAAKAFKAARGEAKAPDAFAPPMVLAGAAA